MRIQTSGLTGIYQYFVRRICGNTIEQSKEFCTRLYHHVVLVSRELRIHEEIKVVLTCTKGYLTELENTTYTKKRSQLGSLTTQLKRSIAGLKNLTITYPFIDKYTLLIVDAEACVKENEARLEELDLRYKKLMETSQEEKKTTVVTILPSSSSSSAISSSSPVLSALPSPSPPRAGLSAVPPVMSYSAVVSRGAASTSGI